MTQFVEDGLGSGPWKPSDWTQTSMTLEAVEGHPLAPDTIDTITIDMVADRTKRLERYRRGDFDAVHFLDAGNLDYESTERLSLVNQFPFNSNINLHFKFDNEHLGRRGVRRAIAYQLDFAKAKQLLNTNGIPATPIADQCDLSPNTMDAYLNEDFRSKLIKYGVESKPQQARQAMQAAGYSKQGNRWVGPDGNPIERLQFVNPSGIKKIEIVAQYLSSALEEFGIGNELRFESFNTWEDEFKSNPGGPDMSVHWGGTGTGAGWPFNQWVRGTLSRPPPYTVPAYYLAAVADDYERPTPEGCERVEYEAPPLKSERDPVYGHPVRPTYPTEVGTKDGTGDGQTLYPIKWKWQADQTQDRESIVDLTEKFAWYNNWQLGRIQIYGESVNIAGNTRDFEWSTDPPLGFSQRSTIQMAFGAAEPK